MKPALLLFALAAALPAAAHDRPEASPDAAPAAAARFPVEIETRFALTDHHGRRVTEADFRGRPLLLFFGYARCEGICATAVPLMAEAVAGTDAAALLVTVDPARDSPAAMAEALAAHPGVTGLTGDPAALARLRDRFRVEVAPLGETGGEPVYAHGSFIYLIGRDGRVVGLLPPVLSPDVIRRRLTGL